MKTKLIQQIVYLAGGDQKPAAELLGVSQVSICRYLQGGEPYKPVTLLARMILKEAGIKPVE